MPTQSTALDSHLHSAETLGVHLLGRVDYPAILGLQEYLTYEISGRNDRSGTLLLCEHPPLISVGRNASSTDILISDEDRQRKEIDVQWVGRGGGAFAHGPGQLAIYCLLPLQRLGMGVSEFRRRLETAVCQTCHEYKVPAKRLDHSPGVWGRGGQLAFFGGSVRSWISNFGIYLNVTISPELLKTTWANPEKQQATSIQAHRIQPIQMPALRESLIRTISTQFDYETTDVSTGHPLLKRTTRRVAIHV